MNTQNEPQRLSPWVLLALGVVVIVLLVRSRIFSLFGTVAGTLDKAVKTAGNVAANIDPFNPRGALHKVGDKIGSSAPLVTAKKAAANLDPFNKKGAVGKVVGVGAQLDPLNKKGAVGKVVKKLKFW